MSIDRTDKQILNILQHDAKISNQDLAERVALSPSPCLRRVKQLEENGTISKHVALLDPGKLGLSLSILVSVELSSHAKDRMQAFEQAITKLPEVVQCYLIAGQSADYLLKVMVADMNHYHDFLLKKLTPIEGVSNVQSSFVLRAILDQTALPLDYLAK